MADMSNEERKEIKSFEQYCAERYADPDADREGLTLFIHPAFPFIALCACGLSNQGPRLDEARVRYAGGRYAALDRESLQVGKNEYVSVLVMRDSRQEDSFMERYAAARGYFESCPDILEDSFFAARAGEYLLLPSGCCVIPKIIDAGRPLPDDPRIPDDLMRFAKKLVSWEKEGAGPVLVRSDGDENKLLKRGGEREYCEALTSLFRLLKGTKIFRESPQRAERLEEDLSVVTRQTPGVRDAEKEESPAACPFELVQPGGPAASEDRRAVSMDIMSLYKQNIDEIFWFRLIKL